MSYARNQLLPQVDVNFALTRRETANTFASSFGLDRFQFVTFFAISMPVDRTPQIIDYQNALIDRDRRRREVTQLQRRIADDVKHAVRERDRLVRSLAAAETSVQIGRKEVEVAQLRYERGLSNNLDVVTAESSLLSAEARRIAALADSAVAKLSLRAMLGILDPRKDLGSAGVISGATGPSLDSAPSKVDPNDLARVHPRGRRSPRLCCSWLCSCACSPARRSGAAPRSTRRSSRR